MGTVVVEMTGDEAKLLRSMQRVIEQQAKMNEGFKNTGKNAGLLQKPFDAAIGGLGKMVGSAAALHVAFEAIGTAQKSFVERMERSVDLVRELASAQQEAAKNLAGTSQPAISEALQKTVPKIAEKATFSDLPKITTALGSVSSIVGEQQAPSIVEAAANVTRFKKEDLQTTATATADVVKAAGLKDGREAMAMLLSAGAVARPEELPKLATGASKAIYAGVNASPTQSPVEAAKESAALFAMLSKVDKNGESAATASIQLIEQVRATFMPTKDEELKRLERMKELTDKQAVTDEENLRIERAKITLQEREREAAKFRPADKSIRAESARLGVEEAKVGLVEIQKDAGLTGKEAEELRRLQIQASFAGKDPGTFRSRLEAIRKEPELMRDVEANLKGEAQFKPIMQGLFDPNSIHSKELASAIENVSTDVAKFDAAMRSMVTTPQQAIQLANEKIATASAVKQFKDVDLQMMGAIDKAVRKALEENPLTGLEAFKENTFGILGGIATLGQIDLQSPVPFTSNPQEALKAGIGSLISRQVQIRGMQSNEALSEEDRAKIASLDVSIRALQTMSKQVEAVRPGQGIENKPFVERKIEGEPVKAGAIMVPPPPPPPQPATSEPFARSITNERQRPPSMELDPMSTRIAQASEATAKAIEEQNRMLREQTQILSELRKSERNPGDTSAAIRAQLLAGQSAQSGTN